MNCAAQFRIALQPNIFDSLLGEEYIDMSEMSVFENGKNFRNKSWKTMGYGNAELQFSN